MAAISDEDQEFARVLDERGCQYSLAAQITFLVGRGC
jgi:hypothetical protein